MIWTLKYLKWISRFLILTWEARAELIYKLLLYVSGICCQFGAKTQLNKNKSFKSPGPILLNV